LSIHRIMCASRCAVLIDLPPWLDNDQRGRPADAAVKIWLCTAK
jgi:endogenous inhibitor of DNA gyrase (YacG/DUF329 family)